MYFQSRHLLKGTKQQMSCGTGTALRYESSSWNRSEKRP
jgi:hypothetical protein